MWSLETQFEHGCRWDICLRLTPRLSQAPGSSAHQPSCRTLQHKRAHSHMKDLVQFVTRKHFCTSRPPADCCCYSDSNNALNMPSTSQISTRQALGLIKSNSFRAAHSANLQGVSLQNPAVIGLEMFQVLNHTQQSENWEKEEKFSEMSNTRKDVAGRETGKGEEEERKEKINISYCWWAGTQTPETDTEKASSGLPKLFFCPHTLPP